MSVLGYEIRLNGGAWQDVGNVLTYDKTGLSSATLYTAEVRAYDAAGNRGPVSNLLSQTTGGSPGPDSVSGLVCWLKADAITGLSDGDLIDTWADSSSAGNDATSASNKPSYRTNVLNGLPVVRFDASVLQFFALADFSALTELEAFVVVKTNNDPPSGVSDAGLWTLGSQDEVTMFPWTDGVIYEDFGTTSRKTVGNPSASLAAWSVYNVYSAVNDWQAFLNGTSLYSTATNTVSVAATAYLGWSWSSFNSGGLNGDIAEFVLYSRKLTSPERAAVLASLQGKYAI